jgi:hypothetical protein
MKRPDWTYGFFYRLWSRALHRFNLHHTRRVGPMQDGAYLHRCEWCGVSRKEWPADLSIRSI